MAVPEPYQKQLSRLFSAKDIIGTRQLISSRPYVRLKGTCSLASRVLLDIGE